MKQLKLYLGAVVAFAVLLNKFVNFAGAYAFTYLGISILVVAVLLIGFLSGGGRWYNNEVGIGETLLVVAVPMVVIDVFVPYNVVFSFTFPVLAFGESASVFFRQVSERVLAAFVWLVMISIVGLAVHSYVSAYKQSKDEGYGSRCYICPNEAVMKYGSTGQMLCRECHDFMHDDVSWGH